ncbi:MAG: hypothetical protein Q9159_000618 [Coniocarpon cinnabarinum]
MLFERQSQTVLSGQGSSDSSRPAALGQSSYQSTLCYDPEGWGPLSPFRFDLTPCFLDAVIVVLAFFGVVAGGAAILYLLRQKRPAPIQKNWHFHAKLTLLCFASVSTALQAALQIQYHPSHWLKDFRFWTEIAQLLSIGVIAYVQYIEHQRSRVPNGVVLFFWLFFIIVYAIKLRSLLSQQAHTKRVAYFVTVTTTTAFAIVEFGLEWLVPKKQSFYEELKDDRECPYEYATVFSVLSFSWMTPMMKYGYHYFLTQQDLWPLRRRDTTESSHEKFEEAWEAEHEGKRPSLWFTLFRAYGGPFLRGAVFKTASDVLNFAQPQLLRFLIDFVQSYSTPEPQPLIKGASIAIGMFAVSVSQTMCLHQYFQRAFETGMRIRGGLTSAIYGKAMRLSNEGRAAKSTGDIVNYMAVDTQRLQDLSQYGQMLWSAPLQIVLCMASLYQLVGISMLAGIGVMIVMIPINGVIAKVMKNLQKKQMKTKDARTRLMTEILNNMKSIKLYAWTTSFGRKLSFIRNDQELSTLRRIGAAQAFSNFTWSTTPFLVSCSTFIVFVFTQDKPLTTDIVFPALTLFNLLTFPLTVLPMVITAIIEASVAVNRLTEYLGSDEIQQNAVLRKPTVDKRGEESVRLTNASFTWDRYEDKEHVKDVNMHCAKGDLFCIVGRVGSGKSSLLEAMLGNLWKNKGEVLVRGAVAYVAQSSWIMNASVKENILFGHRWDPLFYDETVKACALLEDFASLPDGDKTEVGERGISLSGGQKARLTLARAVYARADVYILDDVLSAVDGHVGRHLIEKVLGPKGLLNGKARILATNSIPVLSEANQIAMVSDGRIVESGTYDQVVARSDGGIAELVRTANSDDGPSRKNSPKIANDSDDTQDELQEELIEEQDDLQDEEIEEAQEGLTQLAPIRPQINGVARKTSQVTLRRASTVSFHVQHGKTTDDDETAVRSKQTEEGLEQGKVKWSVYSEYAKQSNLTAVCVYLLTLLLAQTAQIGGSVWLKQWAEVNQEYGANPEVAKYIGIYFAFGNDLTRFSPVLRQASRKLHQMMATALFRSPMSFFETTPSGRILNRFSNDIYKIDEVLARTFNMLFVNAARALFTLLVISASTPIFVALIIPLSFLYLYIQRYYLRTSRELKRLDSVSRSPIYAHFQESLSGLSTIRAFRQQKRFSQENQWRVDNNLSAYFPSISANRWLAVRLELIGSVIILAAAGFAIISVASHSGLSAGLVGLSMSYALQITQSLNWIVRQTVEVETNIVSVERALEYARLPSEAAEVIPEKRPTSVWPQHGAVSFHNYSTRYRENLDPVLRDVNVDIRPHEKIGVVGRTGAGKSSLTLALFRIIEPTSGNIVIDDIDTSSIGLLDLRRRLAIIPQDAALFEGTVRDNLDPGHVHDDTELWSVLDAARLKPHVSSMNGSNLSQGQRQLVSLARALLAPSNILVLDEATAAVDVQTDSMLQTTLRSEAFEDRTIITIAHRINTILDSDRILVLEKGRVAEFDTPSALVERRGLFHSLVKEAGLLESVAKTRSSK